MADAAAPVRAPGMSAPGVAAAAGGDAGRSPLAGGAVRAAAGRDGVAGAEAPALERAASGRGGA
ncbi:hypothetical protein ACFQX4_11175 [Roseomonas sp. GCM10028921]